MRRVVQSRSASCFCAESGQAGVVLTAPVMRSIVKALTSPDHAPAL